MTISSGYLVVLKDTSDHALNPQYRGVDRLPPYSLRTPSEPALEAYVFGEVKDEDGWIPNLALARSLKSRFRTPLEYEIIYASVVQSSDSAIVPVPRAGRWLGYDVAAESGAFWSVVRDFPPFEPLKGYLSLLNSAGLFRTIADACRFKSDVARYAPTTEPLWFYSIEFIDD
jgi:hypothetical protein